ncbi:nucleotidyltransferase domain-containing protein [Roseateles sp. P5_E1]
MRPLDVLLSPAEQRLMSAVMLHPDRDFGTVELLDRMGSSRSAGSTVLKRWVDSGLLRERRVGNQRRLAANPAFLLYPELRRMIVKTVGVAQPLAQALHPLTHRLESAFVFGSVAAGTDDSESDIDLAIVGDITLFDVSPLLDAAQAELGRPVHVNLYTAAEWAQNDDPVLTAVRQGPRIDLMEALHAEAG